MKFSERVYLIPRWSSYIFGSGTIHKTFSFLIAAADVYLRVPKFTYCVFIPPCFVLSLYISMQFALKAFFRLDLSGRKWYLSILFLVSNCKLIPLHLVSIRWKVKDRYEITFREPEISFFGAHLSFHDNVFATYLADHVCEKKSDGKMAKI